MIRRHPPCRFCEDRAAPLRIRNGEDARAYFACFDARFPPYWLKLKALANAIR